MGQPFSIIHLSDLHFGRIHHDVLNHLNDFLKLREKEIKVAVLTGDLTQRARKREFILAKDFIDSLNSPLFVVPGNHDVPLYNLFLRFLSPYKKFLKYLGPFAENYYEDDAVAIFGLWTVDNFAVQTGKLRRKDLDDIEQKFSHLPEHKIKIIASHHPLLSIEHPRIKEDLERLLKLNPHFFMWGHVHQSGIHPFLENRNFPLILSSGTASSTRTRDEANSFNYLTFYKDRIVVEIYRHSAILGRFEVVDSKESRRM